MLQFGQHWFVQLRRQRLECVLSGYSHCETDVLTLCLTASKLSVYHV